MKRQWDVLTGLDVCVDLILTGDVTPEFHQVEKLVENYSIEMGGSGAIFACQCAKLGMRTVGLGVRGDDAFGAAFERSLLSAGVDAHALRTDKSVKTGLGLCLVREDDRAILTYSGTIDALTGLDFTDELLAKASHLHIASYFLMAKLRKDWPDTARRAKSLGLTVSLDTNWDPEGAWEGLDELFPWVDIFLPNAGECRALGGVDALRDAVPLLVVKKGVRGASAYVRGGGVFHAAAFSMPYVDAIGAGDSFDAGFVSAYLNGLSIPACLAAGCACGSLSVRAQGGTAGQGNFTEISDLLKERGIDAWPT